MLDGYYIFFEFGMILTCLLPIYLFFMVQVSVKRNHGSGVILEKDKPNLENPT